MAVIELYAYNGPGMSPWHSRDVRRPSNPPDWTMCWMLGGSTWFRSIRPDWMSDWFRTEMAAPGELDALATMSAGG